MMGRIFQPLLFVALALLLALGLPSRGWAQDAAGMSATISNSATDALIKAMREAGGTVVVIQPEGAAPEPAAAPAPPSFYSLVQDDLLAARARLRHIVGEADVFWSHGLNTFMNARPEPGQRWLGWVLFSAALSVLAGLFAVNLYGRWARQHFATRYDPNPRFRVEKLDYLLMRLLLQIGGLTLFVAVALFVGIVLDGGHRAYRVTVLTIIAVAATYRVVTYLAAVVLARDAPGHRMVPLNDDEATALTSTVRAAAIIMLTAAGLCYWMANLGHDHAAHQLLLIVATLLCAIVLIGATYRHRATIGKIILGDAAHGPVPAWRRGLASAWLVPVSAYFAVAWGIGAMHVLLDRPLAFWLVIGPVAIAVASLLMYWLMIYIADRIWPDPEKIHPELMARASAQLDDADKSGAEHADPITLMRSPMHTLFERVSVVVAGILALFLLSELWGTGLTDGGIGDALRDIGIICFLGYLAFDAVRIAINHRMAVEEPTSDVEDGEAEFGQGATRLATLLPLVRNSVLIAIFTIVLLVVLSKLGLDIGPLLAGAGVVGLAVGFGAQTLVRDVMSGMFFLLDDAFRRGEYINVGDVKGTVVKISIRSMQLRHHRGALHTVPFGEISRLTNHSRDWAIMKLPIRVTYDTDVEKLRKLIKKMGQELLEHPEYGPLFIDPVKSQGVVQMEDSAMILRVKFKSKPQDQFVLRKVIYARIQDLFDEHDIPFAHREVLVRVTGVDDHDGVADEAAKTRAAAGAAAQAITQRDEVPATADSR